jgi:hypothetical protein
MARVEHVAIKSYQVMGTQGINLSVNQTGHLTLRGEICRHGKAASEISLEVCQSTVNKTNILKEASAVFRVIQGKLFEGRLTHYICFNRLRSSQTPKGTVNIGEIG